MNELFVDNFAGGGGASTGIEIAIGRNVDIAINHDPAAIAMHKINHPNTRHYCEDVWEVNPVEVCGGKGVALAWFSPDCRHFSRAKGGKPVDNNVRGLAWVAVKWALLVRPRVIMLENVTEIQTWCPLGEDNKPIRRRSGETFNAFISVLTCGIEKSHPAFIECCNAIDIHPDSDYAKRLLDGLGYKIDFREIMSCDYGAPTSRNRFYMIARSDGKEIVWPETTHASIDCDSVSNGTKQPYRTIAECIDWSIAGTSIFNREKPLCEKTLARIAKGLKKFVVDADTPYIVDEKYLPYLIQYHSETASGNVRGQNITSPIMTLDTSNRYALITPYITDFNNHEKSNGCTEAVYAYLIKYYGHIQASSLNKPLDTLTTRDRFALITVKEKDYVIEDIYMRFLTPREMFNATGFPTDYIIDYDCDGKKYSKAKQTARCGNAVTPPVATALVRANLPEYCDCGGVYK